VFQLGLFGLLRFAGCGRVQRCGTDGLTLICRRDIELILRIWLITWEFTADRATAADVVVVIVIVSDINDHRSKVRGWQSGR